MYFRSHYEARPTGFHPPGSSIPFLAGTIVSVNVGNLRKSTQIRPNKSTFFERLGINRHHRRLYFHSEIEAILQHPLVSQAFLALGYLLSQSLSLSGKKVFCLLFLDSSRFDVHAFPGVLSCNSFKRIVCIQWGEYHSLTANVSLSLLWVGDFFLLAINNL